MDLQTLADTWRRTRPARRLIHLDSAAAGRSSWAVLDAAAAHTRREAEAGAYVAATEVAGELAQARDHVRRLLGWTDGTVAFVHSAEDALRQLLLHWPGDLPVTVAHPRGEYGPNLGVLRQLGVSSSPVDGPHRTDPAAVERSLARQRPDLVHLTWIGSHVGTVQPVADVAAVCARAGVPLVVDAAQAFGHVDTTTTADVVYGTSRKWLAGPRGVGFVAVRGELAERITGLEQAEAHAAGRVGLARALAEHVDLGPARVHEALAAVGTRTRAQLADELPPGWQVVEEVTEPSATVTVHAPDDVDLARVRERLLAEHDVLTTFCGLERSPGEMSRPSLRISGHLDTATEDVSRFAAALRSL